jgi:Flp pilus assembly protein TadD
LQRAYPAKSVAWFFTLVVLCVAVSARGSDQQTDLERARNFEQSGKLDQSIAIYQEVLKSQPASVAAYQGLGRAYFRSRQYAQAVESLEHALRLKAGDEETLHWLARSYLQAGESQKVLNLFPHDTASAEERPWVHFLLARAYDAQDKVVEANRELRRVLALDPRFPGAHFALGFIAWTNRRLPAAEQEFREELAISPGKPVAMYYLAELLLAQDRVTEAAALLNQMTRQAPNSYLTYFGHGKLAERKGDFEEAANQYREASRLAPRKVEVHYHLALVLHKLGRDAEARKELEVSQRLRKQNPMPLTPGMGLVRPRLPDLD